MYMRIQLPGGMRVLADPTNDRGLCQCGQLASSNGQRYAFHRGEGIGHDFLDRGTLEPACFDDAVVQV
jgi:hypothetical protein